ncbi:MAG: 50S ribosomal protein L25/general stress protein Ctc [Betaproteobacteria bacterium]|nr:MAG: 50S ribosomal protein L25/general stress protein Ctc [Betaproteobacteria bacterium]
MATIEVNAVSRSVQGTGASRRLRRTGKVPGIVYGASEKAQVIELDHKALLLQLRHEAFHASILSMNVDGKKQNVLLRDVQMHPWKQEVLHIDFQRVDAKQKIHMRVPLHFMNEEIAPGVKVGGGVVNHVMTDVEISCLPADLPEYLEVDLAEAELGDSLHLSAVKLPQGVESVQLSRGDDAVVASVQVPRVVVEPEEEVEAAAEEAVEGAEEAPAEEQPAAASEEEK